MVESLTPRQIDYARRFCRHRRVRLTASARPREEPVPWELEHRTELNGTDWQIIGCRVTESGKMVAAQVAVTVVPPRVPDEVDFLVVSWQRLVDAPEEEDLTWEAWAKAGGYLDTPETHAYCAEHGVTFERLVTSGKAYWKNAQQERRALTAFWEEDGLLTILRQLDGLQPPPGLEEYL